MEDAVVEFGKEEKKGLAEGMEPKKMGVCQDENFYLGTCHFILLETYSSGKKAEE